ncbi:GFA family protein [Roseivivax sp. CAU 1753]
MINAYRRTGALSGHCMCGAVTIAIVGGYVAAVGLCHCGMCQRWNGVAFGCFSASPEAVTISGPVKRHASSDFAERAFCATCGSHLWMRNTQPEDDYEFMPGLFPGAADFPLVSEVYVDQAPSYLPLSGDHKRATRAEYEAKNLFVEGDAP